MTTSLSICQQMQHLVENLLELARADAGQLQVASDEIDWVALMNEWWAPFTESAARRRLEVTWQLPEACPATTDRTKVCMILRNLFDNAVTYTDEGGQVTIALDSERDEIRLRISNTGSRVTETDADRVFDRFWRADDARTADGDSRRYGLGLPLCQKLVTLLGGGVSASSASGDLFVISAVFPR